MESYNKIIEVFGCMFIMILMIICVALLVVMFNKLKDFILDKIRQLKNKQYAVTYLIHPKCSYIDNKNDDDIKVLSFGTYQDSTRTEYFEARSKAQAIAKFYMNSNYRTFRNYDDVLIIAVNEVTFVK